MDSSERYERRAARIRRRLGFGLFGATALIAVFDAFGIGGEDLAFAVGGPIYDLVVISAGLACLARAYYTPRERSAWILIGAGILAWAAGESYWSWFYFQDPSPPSPSPSDAGYLALYPLLLAGLWLLVRARIREIDPRSLDGRPRRSARDRGPGNHLHLRLRRRPGRRDRGGGDRQPHLPAPRHRPAQRRGRRLRPHQLAAREDLDHAAGRANADRLRRHRLQPRVGERQRHLRRLDRAGLPALGRHARGRCLAVRGAAIALPLPPGGLARADGPGDLRRDRRRPSGDALPLPCKRALGAARGRDRDRHPRPPGGERSPEPDPARTRPDRRAHLARQPQQDADRPRPRVPPRQPRRAGRAAALRPRRFQALQRHLRPPGRRRAAQPPRPGAARRGQSLRLGIPDRRRRVLRPAALRAGSVRDGDRGRRGGAAGGRRRLRGVQLLGERADPRRGSAPERRAADGRRAAVRAQGLRPRLRRQPGRGGAAGGA